jgi:hypothetical protein
MVVLNIGIHGSASRNTAKIGVTRPSNPCYTGVNLPRKNDTFHGLACHTLRYQEFMKNNVNVS